MSTTYARIEARIPIEIQQIIKQAANLEGRTLTDFMIKALSEAAKQTIEENQMVKLSMADQQRFVEIMRSSNQSTVAMQEAMKLHEKMVQS
ncbi:type II toxin-antitoxin system TacA family antitoxin [Neisseria sp.]